MGNKRGELVFDKLIIWIIAFVAFAFMIILFLILTGKGGSALEYLKSVFRFGR